MEELFKNNKVWVAEQLEKDPDYFKKLAQGQCRTLDKLKK